MNPFGIGDEVFKFDYLDKIELEIKDKNIEKLLILELKESLKDRVKITDEPFTIKVDIANLILIQNRVEIERGVLRWFFNKREKL